LGEARAGADTDPGSAEPTDRDDGEALVHALTVLSMFGDNDRLWTDEVLARLAVHDPAI